ncbi:MAG: sigma 54-interacting transcriptional regulator, partial [Labilithrix sp.]|nr:sigma 54-interacting transcriptional regulator [Labilithrix sp.]
HKIAKVARSATTVLLLGETGSGKDRLARLIHASSDRASGPFVAVNCAAIPENLVESELFGVDRGAFTGATESRPGRFERAHGGTLFLDEIGTLSPSAQCKLLRVLQDREVERVGGLTTRPVDIRVVAATNEDLVGAVDARRFRADLFYRISVFPVRVPPLRERRDDVPILAEAFVDRFARQNGKRVAGIAAPAMRMLLEYDYPGNVRELENMIERAVLLCEDGGAIAPAHLAAPGVRMACAALGLDLAGGLSAGAEDAEAEPRPERRELAERVLDASMTFADLERALLEAAVARADGNLSLAARLVGMSRPQLAYRLRKRG